MALIDKLTAIADAIRGKTGKTEEMTLDQMATEIAGIETGGGGDANFAKLIEATIVNLSNEDATKVGSTLLKSCKTLTSVNLPNVITLGADCFSGCSNLQHVNLPKLETIYGTCFGFTGIITVSFPALKLVTSNSNFSGCSKLTTVDFGVHCYELAKQSVFANCSALSTVILRNISRVVTLGNVNSFNGTPFASGGTGGTVYVPQALIEQYQQATNWSTLYAAGTCNFVAIEGSEYE